MPNNDKPIRGFKDLDVYQNSYIAMLAVHRQILPLLPPEEKFDLRNQLSRSTKAVPRLIGEGYAKKHQRSGFQKYLDDAHTESNETIVGLEQCKDLYNIQPELCNQLSDSYDKISRQIFRLAEAWDNFHTRSKNSKTNRTIAEQPPDELPTPPRAAPPPNE